MPKSNCSFTDTVTVLKKAVRTMDGFLICEALATKPGVFQYVQADGSTFNVFRPPEEVFKEDSMNTLRMKPVTLEHPTSKRVTPKNAKQLQVGSTGEQVTNIDNKAVSVSLVVTDENAINALNNGICNVSCGYQCDMNDETGLFEGQQYDHKQENIVYNHLAITKSPRLGKDMVVALDSLEKDSYLQIDSEDKEILNTLTQRSTKMPKYIIDGIEYDAAPEVVNHIKKLSQQLVDSMKEMETTKAASVAVKAEKDQLQAKHDALKTENDSFKAEVKKITDEKARTEVVTKATAILPKETKLDSMSNEEIKAAVVKHAFPKLDLKEKSADYVNTLFDAASVVDGKDDEAARVAAENRKKSAQQHTTDGTEESVEDKQKKMNERAANAWKLKA